MTTKKKVLKLNNSTTNSNSYICFDRITSSLNYCSFLEADLIPEKSAEILAEYLGLIIVEPPVRYGIFINIKRNISQDYVTLQLYHNIVKLIGGICFEFLNDPPEENTLPVYFDTRNKAEAFLEGLSSVYPKSFYKDAYVEQVFT